MVWVNSSWAFYLFEDYLKALGATLVRFSVILRYSLAIIGSTIIVLIYDTGSSFVSFILILAASVLA